MKIAPSILAADFGHLAQQVYDADAAGADWIHVDVMDGRFVPTITFGIPIVKAVRAATTLPVDVHLMIVEPERHFAAFAEAGAHSISIHLEACPNLHRNLLEIRELGLRAGVAINPHSPATLISEVMSLVDILLVMTVNPGKGGQTLIPESFDKIERLRQMADATGREIDIVVDGGVTPHNARDLMKAGATVLVAGSVVFGDKDGVTTAIERLREGVL